jgi:hypothetical protein
MAQPDSRSLQQIKRETEQTRAGLTDTVEQLRTSVTDTARDIRQRISPDAIKAEVSDYLKSRGERLWEDVTASARKNPMQAVAIGAGVAYPLMRLVRAIPVPVLMVGAGLFLAGSKTGQSLTQKASDAASDLTQELGRRAGDLGDQLSEAVEVAETLASDRIDRVSEAGTSQVGQFGRNADAASLALASGVDEGQVSVADHARELKDKTVGAAGSVAATIQDVASGAGSAVRGVVVTAADAGEDAVKGARNKASELTDRAGKTIFETIEQNPLLVAGVGLLVGGLLASALPRSDIEDELVGDASNSLKRQAQTAAAQGIDVAKDAVGEVYDRTVQQAEAEGLSPDGIDKAAQDIGTRVRRVAESAVAAAFAGQDHLQTDTNGGPDHGRPDDQG